MFDPDGRSDPPPSKIFVALLLGRDVAHGTRASIRPRVFFSVISETSDLVPRVGAPIGKEPFRLYKVHLFICKRSLGRQRTLD